MKAKIKTTFLPLVFSLILTLVLFFCGVFEKPIAVSAAYAYIITHYLDQGLITLQAVDYDDVFDNYIVRVKIENTGEERVMTYFPKWCPVLRERNTFNELERPSQ